MKMMQWIGSFQRWIARLNLFIDPDKSKQENHAELHQQLLMTRVFLVSLKFSLIALTAYTLLSTHSISMTVVAPSIDAYDTLDAKYPATLSCLCQEVSLPHSSFITVVPKYHQVGHSILLLADGDSALSKKSEGSVGRI